MESSDAHDESAAQAAEPMSHDAPSRAKKKDARPSRLGSSASALLGLAIVAGAVGASLFPDNEIVRNFTKLGVKPNVAMVGGFGLLLMALVLAKLEALAIRMARVSDAASKIAETSHQGQSDQTADLVTSRLEPTMITVSQQAQQISEQVATVDSAVQGFASQAGKTASSLDEQRRQHATMTTALDNLGKQLEKGIEKLATTQQPQRPSYASPSASAAPNADMLTPITKALDDLARDQTSRAAKMHASMRELTDSMKSSAAPIEAAAKSAVEQASKQLLDSMSKTIESMTKSMETMSKSLEARSKVVETKIEGLEEKVSAMQSAASESRDALAGLGSVQSLGTQLKTHGQSIDAVAKSVAEIRMSMSNGTSSGGSKNLDAMASKLDRLAAQLAAVLNGSEAPPAADQVAAPLPPKPVEEEMQMSIGPKESKTMIGSIERLRRLRTND